MTNLANHLLRTAAEHPDRPAVKLDEQTIKDIGDRVGEKTGRQVELASDVDPDILGGIVLRVGNFILDASIRNRLNQLRKQVAKA